MVIALMPSSFINVFSSILLSPQVVDHDWKQANSNLADCQILNISSLYKDSYELLFAVV